MDSFSEYSEAALRTAEALRGLPRHARLAYLLGQLASESGELAAVIAKPVLRGTETDVMKVREEAGDVLWVLNAILDEFGEELETAAAENIRKLRKRFPGGYTVDDDIKRRDVA